MSEKYLFEGYVLNFTEANKLKIWGCVHTNPDIGRNVSLEQRSGGLGFQHTMTVKQARRMAEMLICACDVLESCELPEGVEA